MPISIRKHGNRYCLVEPDGNSLGCHYTRQGTLRQLAAIEVNKAFVLNNDKSQLRHMFLISSNAYRDREEEIVKSTGLKEYAAGQTMTKPEDNVLLFWHDGDPLGDIVYAEFYKNFLLEIGKERPDAMVNIGSDDRPIMASIKTVWDNIENHPGSWNTSMGFRVLGKTKGGIIYPIDKFETSVLPSEKQANWFTTSEVI